MPDMIPATHLDNFAAHLAALAADPGFLSAPEKYDNADSEIPQSRSAYRQGKAQAYRSIACYIRRIIAGQAEWPTVAELTESRRRVEAALDKAEASIREVQAGIANRAAKIAEEAIRGGVKAGTSSGDDTGRIAPKLRGIAAALPPSWPERARLEALAEELEASDDERRQRETIYQTIPTVLEAMLREVITEVRAMIPTPGPTPEHVRRAYQDGSR